MSALTLGMQAENIEIIPHVDCLAAAVGSLNEQKVLRLLTHLGTTDLGRLDAAANLQHKRITIG